MGSGGIAPPVLTLTLDGGEWSASPPDRSTTREIDLINDPRLSRAVFWPTDAGEISNARLERKITSMFDFCAFTLCYFLPEHNYRINWGVPMQEYAQEHVHNIGCHNHFAGALTGTPGKIRNRVSHRLEHLSFMPPFSCSGLLSQTANITVTP
jgi:hypothetical protein